MRNSLIWHDPPSTDLDPALSHSIGGHPLVAQILARRGFTTPAAARAFLSPDDYPPAPPGTLPDLLIAAESLTNAIHHRWPILVWGDFDVDGQTATALLVDGLRRLGADVMFYIPHRLRESHGISLDSLRDQLATRQPRVLLSCDTGVSAHESVDYAKSQGVITLITDHHDLPPTLPQADAVINPKRLAPNHPLASLPGVGVAYKLLEYLYTGQGRTDELPDFLDLVALGIVADVAEQTRDTRYLLQRGLEQLQTTRRIGLKTLFEIAGVQPDALTTTDIGFQIGPRLNAAGRLADATPAVELLITPDPRQAALLAAQLEGLNIQRRLQTRQIYAAAQEQIARDPALLNWEALVLAHPAWHAGIIGIVAGQLAGYYERPVILLSVGEDGRARGSARSAPGYDIGAAIAAQADLLLGYGGHPGAAGLSMLADHIPAFRRRISDTLHATRDPAVRPGLALDAYVQLEDITPDLALELHRLAPFGEGNPPVILATTDLHLKSAAALGRTGEHRRLTVEDARGNRQPVLWWSSADRPLPEGVFDMAYELDFRTFQGDRELQVILRDHRRSASAPVEVDRPRRQVTDLRDTDSPSQALDLLLERHPGAAVWAEGYRLADSPGVPASELPETDTLIIYTTPPSPRSLQATLERARPVHVVLLAVDPPLHSMAEIQRRVLELIKYVINRQDGVTTIEALAAAVGQADDTIRLALDYYAVLGEIMVTEKKRGAIHVAVGHGRPHEDPSEARAALAASIAETAAFRAFFHRADPGRLLGWDIDS